MTATPQQPSEGTNNRHPCPPVLARVTRTLAGAGVDAPRVEAELLAAHVLGVPRGRLLLVDGLTDDQLDQLAGLVTRRAAREPLQHLTGTAGFRHLELAVGPGVFVPRPETELLAGWGIDRARRSVEPLVVDLCSGSGAVALAVAQEVPTARVVAVERSAAALVWLRRNATDRAAAGDRPIEVVEADVTAPGLLDELAGRVDVLLCNPPYVPAGTAVPPEVADDPAEAVFGGADGLAVVRPVVARAARLLRPGGALAVEHDDTHGRAVPDLITADGRFEAVTGHADLAGRPRFTTALRRRDDASGPAWQTGSS
ncbi:protein-(glutamine-N5) methyltransferase, release factor-specific [Micromonospora echinospora]|uniref:Release factor glutamine methyltransferase n=1 Tax=Micromonospora echinospora TaxID=1877 RepID=A0A1C4XNZ0_MICEC|nr:peptide chain release factor N(5)-glutamine methyltransferase [Micromonospora echinospora]OZV76624.1 protein-(glutamine-N5) methyltransferase, release factor-specific [Micromonospora echinospora]SCF10154.1 release factor glutamine methyltransferase [Micromonospora echinospora]